MFSVHDILIVAFFGLLLVVDIVDTITFIFSLDSKLILKHSIIGNHELTRDLSNSQFVVLNSVLLIPLVTTHSSKPREASLHFR